jgi:tetratricopeptide (TPR) repeat protein
LTAWESGDDRRLAHHAAGCGDRAAVLRHAPLAAARAARLGAHREAADQFKLALRYHDLPDRRRATLLEQLSYELYLTDQLENSRDSRLQALEIHELQKDVLSIGMSQRWLSRLSWFLAQNADSERYAAAAVATLESLEPGRELAMAYSNLAQLRMIADDATEAVRWGTKAIELARRLGDRDAEAHALNNVGTALSNSGDVTGGRVRLTQSLDLARGTRTRRRRDLPGHRRGVTPRPARSRGGPCLCGNHNRTAPPALPHSPAIRKRPSATIRAMPPTSTESIWSPSPVAVA